MKTNPDIDPNARPQTETAPQNFRKFPLWARVMVVVWAIVLLVTGAGLLSAHYANQTVFTTISSTSSGY